MFFPKLRRRAKWMFVFLALIFGLGYVIFNVGGTIPGVGLGDVLQNLGQGADVGPSVDESRERIRERPRDPVGYRDLATALQREGRTREAIDPLREYVRLRPNDRDALQQLASLHLVQARRYEEQGTRAQARLTELTGGGLFAPGPQGQFGQEFGNPQITELESSRLNQRLNDAYLGIQESYREATRVLQQLVRVTPDEEEAEEPLVFLQLGQAATNANQLQVAINAYERYLEVAAGSATARSVRLQLQQLRAAAASQTRTNR